MLSDVLVCGLLCSRLCAPIYGIIYQDEPEQFLELVRLSTESKNKCYKSDHNYSEEQQDTISKIKLEAFKQHVPSEFALAIADVETGFINVQNKKGVLSFGPMQVHVSNLERGERKAALREIDFNIKKGVGIIKDTLKRANGSTLKARLLYFCGYKPCKLKTQIKVLSRWQRFAKKWTVYAQYKPPER